MDALKNVIKKYDHFIFIKGWTEWGNWSECQAKCGEGTSMRTRECLADGNKTEESVCETRLGGNYKEKKGCEVGTPCYGKYINILYIGM